MRFAVRLTVFTWISTLFHDCPADNLIDDQNNQTASFTNEIDGSLTIAKEFCPMTCKESNLLNEGRQNRCCIKCDCRPLCVATGTCCNDAPLKNNQADSMQEADDLQERCVQTTIGDIRAQPQPNIIHGNAYMLIQSCKRSTEQTISDDVMEKCVSPDEKILEELLPVYSNITEKNYRNIFCAICNRDNTSTITWGVKISLNNTLTVMDIFPKTTKLSTDTSFLPKLTNDGHVFLQMHPNNNKTVECIIQSKVLSKCPNKPLSFGKHLCEEGHYSPVRSRRGIYRNMFCFICNSDYETYESSCYSFMLSDLFDVGMFTILLGPEPFNAYHRHRPEQQTLSCKSGKVYDSQLKRCLLKECAITEVKDGNSCLPLLQMVHGISLDYRLKVIYSSENFNIPNEELFFQDLLFAVRIPYILLCSGNILSIETVGKLVIVHVRVIKLEKMLDINVLEEFESVQKAIDKFNRRSDSLYSIELDTSAFNPISRSHVTFASYSDDQSVDMCGPAIAITAMQFCNVVLIKNFDILDNGVVIVDGHSGAFSPGEYILSYTGNQSSKNDKYNVQICYDLFIARASNSSKLENSSLVLKQDAGLLLFTVCLFYVLASRSTTC